MILWAVDVEFLRLKRLTFCSTLFTDQAFLKILKVNVNSTILKTNTPLLAISDCCHFNLQAVVEKTLTLWKEVGMSPLTVIQAVAGFVINRLQYALMAEAYRLVEVCIVGYTLLPQHLKYNTFTFQKVLSAHFL